MGMEQPIARNTSEEDAKDVFGGTPEVPFNTTQGSAEKQRLFYIEKLQAPYIRSFFKLIKDTPHLWDQALMRYSRKEEFSNIAHDLDAPSDKIEIFDQKHIKRLVPLWSAACTVPELRAYFELALNAAAQEESKEIKKKMEKDPQYVTELGIGGGVHAAAYNAEFMHYAPDVSRLSVEEAGELGGQFRQYGGPAFRMNTHNRPINIDRPNDLDNPNTNSFGPYAPLQLTDVSGNLFADNEQVGTVAALNQYLSAKTVLDTSVTKVTFNADPRSSGKYQVELTDAETKETYLVTTDRLVVSSGLGKAKHGFAVFDESTERLCSSKDGRIMTYPEFLKEVGDRTNPFPLERFANKRVVIVGGGHSALTVTEYLVGLGPEYRGSVSSLGYPREIVILGSKFEDSRDFLEGEIPRYTQLAAAIQKKDSPENDSKPHLIRPIVGMRALSLREEERRNEDGSATRSSIVVKCKSKSKGKEVSTTFVPEEEIEADIIITTTGFDNTGHRQIFADLMDKKQGDTPEFDDMYVEGVPHPVGRYLHGHTDIVFVGPAAGMPTSQQEIDAAKMYNHPTNSVAIPNTVDDTRACARHMVLQKYGNGDAEKFPGFGVRYEKKFFQPFVADEGEDGVKEFIMSIPARVAAKGFPSEIRYEELLRFTIQGHVSKYFAESPISLKIEVSREENSSKNSSDAKDLFMKVSCSERLSSGGELFVKEFLADSLAQAAIAKLTERRRGTSKPVEVSFTVGGGNRQ